MKSRTGLFLLAAATLAMIGVCGQSMATVPVVVEYEGLTPGYWKNHTEDWVGYATDDLVGGVFACVPDPLADATLLEALKFHGGAKQAGAQRILLRAAVAALLNAACPEIDYPTFEAGIISAVNAAIESDDREAMLELKDRLDEYNNLGRTDD